MLPEAGAGSSPGVLMDVTPPLLCNSELVQALLLLLLLVSQPYVMAAESGVLQALTPSCA